MTVESVAITNGTIQSEGNTIVAISEPLNFNETTNLTIVARLNEGVIAGAVIQNLGCATAVGASTSVCDTAAVRVSPDAELLPATGVAAPDSTPPTTTNPVLTLTVLYLLGLFAGVNGLIGALTRNEPPLELRSASFNIHTWGSFPVLFVVAWKTYLSYFTK